MTIKIGGDRLIEGLVKEKERAREIYEDAIAGGYQAGLLEEKEQQEEKVLRMKLGNIEPGEVIEVEIGIIEQAKVMEGAYAISIPTGMILIINECFKNSEVKVDIRCSSMIAKVYCPNSFK